MNIRQYSFGRITIEGRTYTKDVIVYPDSVHSPWWRKEGHILHVADLETIMQSPATCLVIGTGYNGAMHVPEDTLQHLRSRGFDVIVKKTQDAVTYYNGIPDTSNVIAALHLTC